jgi:hypothetical protein
MVPFVTIWSARLIPRFGLAPLAALGSALFAAGIGWRIVTASTVPHYATDLLPSMLVTGIGVGLALPTFIAAAATALPADRAATASGTVNSVRQVASGLGVAVLVTFLGGGGSALSRFDASWWVTVALALAAGAVGLALREPRPTAVTERAVAVARPGVSPIGS